MIEKYHPSFLTSVLKWYKELKQEFNTTYPYRIVDKKYSKKLKQDILIIQASGRNIFFESTLKEILGNEEILQGFSPQDVRNITYLYCVEVLRPNYKIIAQEYSEELQQDIFTIKKIGEDHSMRKTAEEISTDKEFIKQFGQLDAHKIGYNLGEIHSANERKLRK